MTARRLVKSLANLVALSLAAPCAFSVWLEHRLLPASEAVFGLWANVVAVLPGPPGMFIRRAYYHLVLESCSLDCYLGFGMLFTHRRVVVEPGTYVGPYSLVGCSRLGRGSLVGSRVSILSGPALHTTDSEGRWLPADLTRMQQVEIGENVWIGEGAIVMVNVGAGSLVGTGSVVSTRVRPHVVVAGNPARFVRRLLPDEIEREPAEKGATSARTGN